MFFRYINIYYVTHHIAATDYNIWIGLLKIQIRANTSRHRTNTFQENVIFNRKQGLCFKGMCRYGTLQFCLALKKFIIEIYFVWKDPQFFYSCEFECWENYNHIAWDLWFYCKCARILRQSVISFSHILSFLYA